MFDALVEIGKQDHPRLELTDALALVLARGGKVYAYEIEAKREDIGAVLAQASGLLSSEEPHRQGRLSDARCIQSAVDEQKVA